MTWRDEAACLDKPIDWFFVDDHRSLQAGRKVCASCPVQGPCLRYAIDEHILHGLFGGKSPLERRRIRNGVWA